MRSGQQQARVAPRGGWAARLQRLLVSAVRAPSNPRRGSEDRESQERYFSLLNSIDEGFCVIEMVYDDTGTPIDYIFLETNRAFEQQTGLRAVLGEPISRLVPLHEDYWLRAYSDVALTGEPIRFENHARGLNRWYSVYAYRVGEPRDRTVAVLFNDITERKLAESALRQSERRLSELFESIPAFVAILRGPDHVFDVVNRSYEDLVGRRDVVGKPLLEVIPEIADQPFPGLLQHVYETGEIYESRGTRALLARGPGGAMEERWLDFVFTPLRGPDGAVTGINVFGVDLTDRIRAEEALRESQLALTSEISAMNHLQELSARLLVAPDITAVLEEVLTASISLLNADLGTVQFYDEAARCLRPVSTRGFAPEHVGLFSEVYAEHASPCGAALRCGRRVVIEDVESDPDFADHRDLARLFGYRAAQTTPLISRAGKLLGTLTTHFRHPRRPTDRELRVLDLYARQASDLIERLQIDDTLREAQDRHRERLEELVAERTSELVRSNESLRLSERMAALGTFALGVGHDLNNLLLPVRERLASLAARADGDAEFTDDVSSIEGALRHIHSLARGLRVYASDPDGDGSTGPTDLARWCDEASVLLRTGLPASIDFECRIEPRTPPAAISPGRLSQAVLNLVQNARDAIVTARGRGAPGRVELGVGTSTTAGVVRVWVSDDGPGMPEEVRRRCTEPFFTTKPRSLGGTGLGLSIVHGIAASAGGRSEITTSPGGGTTVTILLPAASPEPGLHPDGAHLARRVGAVSLRDPRAAAFACGLIRATGRECRAAPVGADPGGGANGSFDLWIAEIAAENEAAAEAFAAEPGHTLIVVNGDDRWIARGAIVIPPGSPLTHLRHAIDQATAAPTHQGPATPGAHAFPRHPGPPSVQRPASPLTRSTSAPPAPRTPPAAG